MFSAGVEAGADLIFLETFIDLAMLRVAAEKAKEYGVPVFCSLSFERLGKTMMGNSPDDMIEELEPLGVDAIGMNCSLGPDLAVPIIEKFRGKTSVPLLFKPNAGMTASCPRSTSSITSADAAAAPRPTSASSPEGWGRTEANGKHNQFIGEFTMKKSRYLLIALLSMILAVILTTAALAEDHGAVVDSGQCGDNLTWTLYDDGLLEISGTGEMWEYFHTYPNFNPYTDAPWGNIYQT